MHLTGSGGGADAGGSDSQTQLGSRDILNLNTSATCIDALCTLRQEQRETLACPRQCVHCGGTPVAGVYHRGVPEGWGLPACSSQQQQEQAASALPPSHAGMPPHRHYSSYIGPYAWAH